MLRRAWPGVVVIWLGAGALAGFAQQMPAPDEMARPIPRPVINPNPVPYPAQDAAAVLRIDLLSAAIEAESAGFADQIAATYFADGSGDDWRGVVALIHGADRIAAMWQTRMAGQGARLDAGPRPEAQRVAAARLVLAGDAARAQAVAQYRAALARGEARAARIAQALAQSDLVEAELASRMNRDLAVARGFAEAGGYDFPVTPEDQAADVALTEYDLRDALTDEIGARLYLAFAGESDAALGRYFDHLGETRALQAVGRAAMDDVMIHLARETGRAAARRAGGQGL